MAFGSGGDSGEIRPINEINVTPFVDVVLVLLVIFMVTAPMMMKDLLNLKLPQTTSADSQSMGTLGVVVTAQGQFLVNGDLVSEETLRSRAREAAAKDSKTQVIISADTEAKHGAVVRVIDAVKSSGLDNFAIQVEKTSEKTIENRTETP